MLFLNAKFQQWKRRLENIKKQDPKFRKFRTRLSLISEEIGP
jgi:hypothetical protein